MIFYQACEWCYKKKIRCEVEGSNTACVQCIRRNINCKFTSRKEKREALKRYTGSEVRPVACIFANYPRTQYVTALEERLKRTETLLRAAGILDEASVGQDELHDDDDELESESEVEYENETASVSPNLSRKDGQTRSHKPTSISTAKLSDNIDSSASSDIPGRRHPTPCKSDYQQIPVFKMDHREESRYYGMPILLYTRYYDAETFRTCLFPVYTLPGGNRVDQKEDWRHQVFELLVLIFIS